ncbi:hypothetical protein, partial [Plasmodium yoelii yoelii]
KSLYFFFRIFQNFYVFKFHTRFHKKYFNSIYKNNNYYYTYCLHFK